MPRVKPKSAKNGSHKPSLKLRLKAGEGRTLEVSLVEETLLVASFVFEFKDNQAAGVLPYIIHSLEKVKVNLSEITKIDIEFGGGSFTLTRQIVSVANTLHWLFNVPIGVVGASASNGFITPRYSGEPNIS